MTETSDQISPKIAKKPTQKEMAVDKNKAKAFAQGMNSSTTGAKISNWFKKLQTPNNPQEEQKPKEADSSEKESTLVVLLPTQRQ